MSKYKCESHKLDLACMGCIHAWIERHNAMLNFIREDIAKIGVLDRTDCDHLGEEARKLLEEMSLEI